MFKYRQYTSRMFNVRNNLNNNILHNISLFSWCLTIYHMYQNALLRIFHKTSYVISHHEILCHNRLYVMTIVASLPPTHTCTYIHTYWQELSSLPLLELLGLVLIRLHKKAYLYWRWKLTAQKKERFVWTKLSSDLGKNGYHRPSAVHQLLWSAGRQNRSVAYNFSKI